MKTLSVKDVLEELASAARGCVQRSVRRRLKAWSVKRRDRLAMLKRQRAKRRMDRLEAELEEMMCSLPDGYERRQCNNDLFRFRIMRAMSGL